MTNQFYQPNPPRFPNEEGWYLTQSGNLERRLAYVRQHASGRFTATFAGQEFQHWTENITWLRDSQGRCIRIVG